MLVIASIVMAIGWAWLAYFVLMPPPVRAMADTMNLPSELRQQRFGQEVRKYVREGDSLESMRRELVALGFSDYCKRVSPCDPGEVNFEYFVPVIFWPVIPTNHWMVRVSGDGGGTAVLIETKGTLEGRL